MLSEHNSQEWIPHPDTFNIGVITPHNPQAPLCPVSFHRLPLAPHLPCVNTTLLLCGFPLPPSAESTSLGLQPTRWAFFHFSSHVRPRFIRLFNQNVIFAMLVSESGGSGQGFFTWCFKSHVCSVGIERQLAPTPIPQTPRSQLSDLLASFH